MDEEAKKKQLELLREPFPENQIGKLPKPFKRDSPKGKCKPKSKGGDAPDYQDHFCGGYHGLPALHLDFVGHAALTDRLLDVDPEWTWKPFSTDDNGLPKLDNNGGMWIYLTVCGVTRIGYGDAQGKKGGDAIKECIGDAIRNAAMRFGAALELWHRGDLHPNENDNDGSTKESNTKESNDKKKTTTNFEFLKFIAPEKKRVGDKAYYDLIGTYGAEHANELTKREDQEEFFRKLKKLPTKTKENK